MSEDEVLAVVRRKWKSVTALFFVFIFTLATWTVWFWGLAAIALAVYLLRPWADAEDRRGR